MAKGPLSLDALRSGVADGTVDTVVVALVSTSALAHRVIPAADQVTTLENIITMEPIATGQVSHAEIHTWDQVVELGKSVPDDIAATAEPGHEVGKDAQAS